jgi:hypothetical protein
MISEETIFVLGAGASAPYGYPIGSELRDDICLNFKSDMNALRERSGNDYGALKEPMQAAADFIECFQKSRIRSIDRWLNLNGKYRDIGKLAIVNTILKREHPTRIIFEGKDKSLDWFSVLFNEMMVGVVKPEHFAYHKVGFITFNYDRVFENLLFESFRNAFSNVPLEEISRILSTIPIIHVYGCIDDPPWKEGKYRYGDSYTLPHLDEARIRIKTVGESIATYGHMDLGKGDLLLRSPRRILFLGFGYDSQNLELLGIPQRFEGTSQPPAIWGTGQGLFQEEIVSIQMKLGMTSSPNVKTCDCTELLRKYFVGQENHA